MKPNHEPCIVCPIEVRQLYAVAHNLLNLVTGQDKERLARKLPERIEELRRAVDQLTPFIQAHFGDDQTKLPNLNRGGE